MLNRILKNIIIILYISIDFRISFFDDRVIKRMLTLILFILFIKNKKIKNYKEGEYLDILYYLIIWTIDQLMVLRQLIFLKFFIFILILILILIWKKYGFKEFIVKSSEMIVRFIISYCLIVYILLSQIQSL